MKTHMSTALVFAAMGTRWCTAHMEFVIVNDNNSGMYMDTPPAVDNDFLKDEPSLASDDTQIIRGRWGTEKQTDDARKPNHPAVGVACHGLQRTTDTARIATVVVGKDIKVGVGAGGDHDGGQCSFFVSDGKDDSTWYKFQDALHCTYLRQHKLLVDDGADFSMRVPASAPSKCASEGCTIMITWAPLHTRELETYVQCFDVKIPGAKGGIAQDYPLVKTPFEPVIRPNLANGKTSMFGKYLTTDDNGNLVQEHVVDGHQTCYQYTVRENPDKPGEPRSLGFVWGNFDISKEELYAMNKDVMSSSTDQPKIGTKLWIVKENCGGEGGSDSATLQAGVTVFVLVATGLVSLAQILV